MKYSIIVESHIRSIDLLNSLTLLTSMSFSSKCRPYIFGDSPGIGSILIQTSCPFRALSTCLWLHSIDVTIPMSKNWNDTKIFNFVIDILNFTSFLIYCPITSNKIYFLLVRISNAEEIFKCYWFFSLNQSYLLANKLDVNYLNVAIYLYTGFKN